MEFSGCHSAQYVLDRWISVCLDCNLDDVFIDANWKIISSKYSEPHRHYHTLEHIEHLLNLSEQYQFCCQDMIAIDLAIIFHDIIYDPRSPMNEEESAQLFSKMFNEKIPLTAIKKVCGYILATKSHKVPHGNTDMDLCLFLDYDMEILASSHENYLEYSLKVRNEYIHVEKSEYCRRRSVFLRNILNSDHSIYMSDEFKCYESNARQNLEMECARLENEDLSI